MGDGAYGEMMAQFESKSVDRLLERNYATIKLAYEALDPDSAYEEFVGANEEILANMTEANLKDWLDSRPLEIFGSSETKSCISSLQYAYLLSRYAEKAAGESKTEKALMVLAESCYFSGFAEGLGVAAMRQGKKVDSSLNARNAALAKAKKNSAPLKSCFLKLLAVESRQDKWSSLAAAVRKHEKKLDECITQYDLPSYSNLSGTMAGWCRTDPNFARDLSEFVKLKEGK